MIDAGCVYKGYTTNVTRVINISGEKLIILCTCKRKVLGFHHISFNSDFVVCSFVRSRNKVINELAIFGNKMNKE